MGWCPIVLRYFCYEDVQSSYRSPNQHSERPLLAESRHYKLMNNLTIRELMIQLTTQLSARNEDHINRIFEILKKRTGEKFANDVDKWIGWYLKSQAIEEDKSVVETGYKSFVERKKKCVVN